ncbi:MAG: RNA polymerase sigma factor region1.1 domain-containing protein, partial [Clostridia bacterium]|nr:RNA polymerase sigma factor region1.1 domain-containing protein [Clostridia bacterium]
MANTEEIKNPAITKLIEKAKAAGYVSSSAISELIETANCDVEQIEKVYETLEELGIEITGSDDLTVLIDDDSF